MKARRVLVAGVLATAVGASTIVSSQPWQPVAHADHMDDLVAQLSDVSRRIEAHTEKVKGLEDDIAANARLLDEEKAQAQAARSEAMKVRGRVDESRHAVDELAKAQYKELGYDKITQIMSSGGPQSALDRSAYISYFALRHKQEEQRLKKETSTLAAAANAAAAARALTEFKARQLAAQRRVLEKESQELAHQQDDIKRRIDSLTVAQRMEWAAKNHPVSLDITGLTGQNVDGLKALRAAFTKIGAPYVWGATGPNAFDCSGLVQWAYRQIGKQLPRTSQAQMAGGTPVPRDQLQPGDVIGFYPGATHVGLYAGNGLVLHAADYGIPVQVVPLDSMPFVGARRY